MVLCACAMNGRQRSWTRAGGLQGGEAFTSDHEIPVRREERQRSVLLVLGCA